MPEPAPQPLPAPDDARKAVEALVQRFHDHRHLYTGPGYNETQVRIEFIDPFLEALGWDVNNKSGTFEAFKDVVHEDAIKIKGASRAPDYSLRYGGQRVLFVEAKKPSVALKGDAGPAAQLRRYAWSAGLPVSILTDFEELCVYDTRHQPKANDAPEVGRVLYLRYDEYLDKLDDLYAIFSREAVRLGRLSRFAEDTRAKRGTGEVNVAFLKTIEEWRDQLAREIALRNPSLSGEQLNFAVQATIDRILFLRIAEDRGVQHGVSLQQIANAPNIYPALCDLFRQADERYNAGLFSFGADRDQVCLGLTIHDKPLRDILQGLYYPLSPYEFSVIPGDILGAVYEQFLGKVIRLTAGHRAKVEEKPEVRKAGGVYYTPRYIVDYIVEHTVGELLRSTSVPLVKHERDAPATIHVLDPACGSGSFLLGAYEYLLAWHLAYYTGGLRGTGVPPVGLPPTAHDRDGHATQYLRGKNAPLVKMGPDDYRLSLAERKRILQECIFGVDLDPQAVEVTKLNLLLKCMEGETAQTLQPQLLGHDRVLPNMDRNIKCGNSLIGWDYFEGQLAVDEEEVRRVRPFDWASEFPEIFPVARASRPCAVDGTMTETVMPQTDTSSVARASRPCAVDGTMTGTVMPQTGGFDCVIGNPPYLGGREWTDLMSVQRGYFLSRYASAENQFDLYALFIERSLDLLREGGMFGYITPNTWLNNRLCRRLREYVFEHATFAEIADYRDTRVFRQATVLPVVAILRRTQKPDHSMPVRVALATGPGVYSYHGASPSVWAADPDLIVNIVSDEQATALLARVGATAAPLSELVRARFGVKPYQKGKGTPPQNGEEATTRLFEADSRMGPGWLPYIYGRDMGRYKEPKCVVWIRYGPHLAEPRTPDMFRGPRVLVRRIVGERLVCTYTDADSVADQMVFTLTMLAGRPDPRYLCALLSSALLAFYFRNRFNRNEKTFPEIRVGEIHQLPIRPIDFADPADVARHDKMVALVEAMLDLRKRLPDAQTTNERDLIQRQITATDKQIDALVYELYGLNEEEIRIVEGTP